MSLRALGVIGSLDRKITLWLGIMLAASQLNIYKLSVISPNVQVCRGQVCGQRLKLTLGAATLRGI